MRYLVGIPVVFLVISIILNFILAGLLALTYNTLTKETPIAILTFEKVKKDEYIATLADSKNNKIGEYLIYGNQWQVDTEFYKVAYFANLLGIKSKYTLDRIRGRYENINDSNSRKTKNHQIESHTLVDTFKIFFDTSYGSSTYKDIKENTLYTIFKTPSGIITREKLKQVTQKNSFLEKAKSVIGY